MTANASDMVCTRCGLRTDEPHKWEDDCIPALRDALLRQREAAATLAFEVSVRYLAIIGQLAKEAGDGTVIGGVYANIKKRYEAMGDWSPMQAVQERVAALADIVAYYQPALMHVSPLLGTEMAVRAKRLGVLLPDPGGSGSPPR